MLIIYILDIFSGQLSLLLSLIFLGKRVTATCHVSLYRVNACRFSSYQIPHGTASTYAQYRRPAIPAAWLILFHRHFRAGLWFRGFRVELLFTRRCDGLQCEQRLVILPLLFSNFIQAGRAGFRAVRRAAISISKKISLNIHIGYWARDIVALFMPMRWRRAAYEYYFRERWEFQEYSVSCFIRPCIEKAGIDGSFR